LTQHDLKTSLALDRDFIFAGIVVYFLLRQLNLCIYFGPIDHLSKGQLDLNIQLGHGDHI